MTSTQAATEGEVAGAATEIRRLEMLLLLILASVQFTSIK